MNKHLSFNEAAKLLDINRRVQLLQQLPRDCLKNTLAGSSYIGHDERGNTVIRHCSCKQLNCRTCAATRLRELYDALSAHAFTHFLVLTLPGDIQHNDCERKLKQALPRFFQEANRIPGSKRLSYFWCLGIDLRPNARLHVNILLNTDFRSATRYGNPIRNWAKKTWHRLTGAHQISLQSIVPGTLGGVVNYILTDMLKTVIKRPSIKRRLGSSSGIKLRRKRKRVGDGSTWGRLPHTTAVCATALGINHNMSGNGTVTLSADKHLDALAELTRTHNGDAQQSPKSPHRGEPSLEFRAAAGGHGLPADGRAGVGTQEEVLP
jgi:hypothetical protein